MSTCPFSRVKGIKGSPVHREQTGAGWCSWYYYYLTINEEVMVRNTDWLDENLKRFGCEWVQVDDGWQGRGKGLGTNRDFLLQNGEHHYIGGLKLIKGIIWMAYWIISKNSYTRKI